MILSKTFAYALRSMLYLALVKEEGRLVQISEIATRLNIPKHFLAKVLQQFSKNGMLESVKGPKGGFRLTPKSMKVNLLEIFAVTDLDELQSLNQCVLRFNQCENGNHCPLHNRVKAIRENLVDQLASITIDDLINNRNPLQLENITS